MIKNDAVLNEELDPKLMIEKLRREVQQLKEELSMATGEQRTDSLTDDDVSRCLCDGTVTPTLVSDLMQCKLEFVACWDFSINSAWSFHMEFSYSFRELSAVLLPQCCCGRADVPPPCCCCLQPLYRTTCISQHPLSTQLRTGGFCCSKVLLPTCLS